MRKLLVRLSKVSDVWTSKEKILFNKAFRAHKKNFYLIHKMVQRKTVAQCVEYYYTWKKWVRFTTSSRAPGLKKRVKRKLGEADPTEPKATCSPKERPKCRPTPEFKIETKSCRRESMVNASPNAGPKRTPEPLGSRRESMVNASPNAGPKRTPEPLGSRRESMVNASPNAGPKRIPEPLGSIQGRGAFPCGECERVFDKICSRNAHMKRHRLQDPVETTDGEERPAKALKLEEEEEEGETGADMGPLQG
ncbi:hypothetical protein MUG91_G267n1 [Manis pentadactyla]|nr:hypothetical protein MUG91_G267n1 [Manis pentadactyla]